MRRARGPLKPQTQSVFLSSLPPARRPLPVVLPVSQYRKERNRRNDGRGSGPQVSVVVLLSLLLVRFRVSNPRGIIFQSVKWAFVGSSAGRCVCESVRGLLATLLAGPGVGPSRLSLVRSPSSLLRWLSVPGAALASYLESEQGEEGQAERERAVFGFDRAGILKTKRKKIAGRRCGD